MPAAKSFKRASSVPRPTGGSGGSQVGARVATKGNSLEVPRPAESFAVGTASAAGLQIDVTRADQVLEMKRELLTAARGLKLDLQERVAILAEASRRLGIASDPVRHAALKSLVEEGGYAPATAAAGLDATLATWTGAAWRALTRRELRPLGAAARDGHGVEADRPVGGFGSRELSDAELVPHILGSALPAPNVLPLFFCLLLGRPTLARSGRRVPSLPVLALEAIRQVVPELAALAGVCRWDHARADLTAALFAGARVGSATGGDDAMAAIRSQVGPATRLLTHPNRASFAYLGAGSLRHGSTARETALQLSRDVALHDQQGCLSPLGVLVESDARGTDSFADVLAAALARREREWPRGGPGREEALAIRSFHDFFALGGGRVLAGTKLSWLVGICRSPEVPPPALFRCIWVRAIDGRGSAAVHAEGVLERWRGSTAAIGFRGEKNAATRARSLASRLGATRFCTVGAMQSPPLWWRQDGRSPLGSLIV